MRAHIIDVPRITPTYIDGNLITTGKLLHNALCAVNENAMTVPMITPISELEKTNMNASYMYNTITRIFVIPSALITAISLICSNILVIIEEDRLK